jgi:hypothetical protein
MWAVSFPVRYENSGVKIKLFEKVRIETKFQAVRLAVQITLRNVRDDF